MRRFLRENGLSLVLFFLFFGTCMVGQAVAGHRQYNEEQREHGASPVAFREYLGTGHFLEATAENWESEFLQMFVYVTVTVFLFQKGSSESKKLDEPNEVDRDPRKSKDKKDAPSPVRKGGVILKLYERSLSIAFLALFLFSWGLHAWGGLIEHNEEQIAHGEPAVSMGAYVSSARFWFESLQNWQSEFLALAAMVVLSIWLRQRGSPESKPVDAPHSETGSG